MTQSKIRTLLNGDFLKHNALRKQYKVILLSVLLGFVYIYAGYNSEQQLRALSKVQKELQDVQFEQLTVNAELARITRPSAIARQLKAQGSPVKESDKPAVHIQ